MFVCSEFTNYLLNYLLGISSSSSWYTGLFLFLFLFFIRSLISTCWRFIIFACALIQSFQWAQTVTTLFWSPYFPAISSRRYWIPTRSPVPSLLRFLRAESPCKPWGFAHPLQHAHHSDRPGSHLLLFMERCLPTRTRGSSPHRKQWSQHVVDNIFKYFVWCTTGFYFQQNISMVMWIKSSCSHGHISSLVS